MSKAFTKNDSDAQPVVARARAPLPAGMPNYVTARGLAALRAELAALEAERDGPGAVAGDDAERDRQRAAIAARIAELSSRIASATVVDPSAGPADRVRFGATVTVRTLSGDRAGEERRFEIVGVDESDPAQGRVAFVSPFARAVMRLEVGDTATLPTADGEELLEIVAID